MLWVMVTQNISLMYLCLFLAVIIRIRQISNLLVLDRHLPEKIYLFTRRNETVRYSLHFTLRISSKNGNCMETKLFHKKEKLNRNLKISIIWKQKRKPNEITLHNWIWFFQNHQKKIDWFPFIIWISCNHAKRCQNLLQLMFASYCTLHSKTELYVFVDSTTEL